MNTAGITGKGCGIYGVGPTPAPRLRPGLSTFVTDVAYGDSDGGTYGTDARYVVGGYADAVVIRASASRSQRAASASEFVIANAGMAVGFWRDLNTGRTWLDVCRGFDDIDEAWDAAGENGELAFYDQELEMTVKRPRS